MIPEVDTVGGFSICNSPTSLQKQRYIELAIKFSDHPPAYWVHTKVTAQKYFRLHYAK